MAAIHRGVSIDTALIAVKGHNKVWLNMDLSSEQRKAWRDLAFNTAAIAASTKAKKILKSNAAFNLASSSMFNDSGPQSAVKALRMLCQLVPRCREEEKAVRDVVAFRCQSECADWTSREEFVNIARVAGITDDKDVSHLLHAHRQVVGDFVEWITNTQQNDIRRGRSRPKRERPGHNVRQHKSHSSPPERPRTSVSIAMRL